MTDGMEQRCTFGMPDQSAAAEPAAPDPGLRGDVGAAWRLAETGGPGRARGDGAARSLRRESPAAAERGSAQPALREQLLRAVAREVLPRLRQAHPAPAAPQTETDDCAIGAGEVSELTQLSMGRHGEAVSAYVDAVHRRGAHLDTLCLGLLTPAARHLGELWDQDECSFIDVTLGLARLQYALSEICLHTGTPLPASPSPHRRVLLLPARGEQHTFGLNMVAEFFRRDGWEVADGGGPGRGGLQDCVRRQWFDAVGFSVGSERSLEDLATDIRQARQASCNRVTVFLVGGPVFNGNPDLAPQVGADGTADSAREAPLQARHLAGLAAATR